MATTPPKKTGGKGKQTRIVVAVGLVALAIVGYLWYRNRGTTIPATTTTGNTDLSGTPSDQSSGDTSGSSAIPDLSGLLSSLQGENQSLLDAFVKGESGLTSLIAQTGSPTTVSPSGLQTAPVTDLVPQFAPPTPAPEQTPGVTQAAAPQAAPQQAAQQLSAAQVTAEFGNAPEITFTPPPPGPPPNLGPVSFAASPGADVGSFASYPTINFTPPAATHATTTSAGQKAVNEKPVVTPHGRAV